LPKLDSTQVFDDGVVRKPNGDFVFPPDHQADSTFTGAGSNFGKGVYSEFPQTVDLIAKTPSTSDIAETLRATATPDIRRDPVIQAFDATYDFLTKSDPQTTNPIKSIINGLIALKDDTVEGLDEIVSATQQFAQDPLGNIVYAAKGTGQTILENLSNTIDDWKWLSTTNHKVVADSAKLYFDDVAKQEIAEAEKNPGAYVFRKARDIYSALAFELIGGGTGTVTKTTKVADELGDAAKTKNTSGIGDDIQPINPGEVLDDVSKTGETSSTLIGKTTHKTEADIRREMGDFSTVNSPISDKAGNDILVPKRVDLKTGQPQANTTPQKAIPDATIYNKGLIIDDKPLGRSIAKDRQEIIRFIKAFEIREGRLPSTIAIQRYDPKTGKPFVTEVYKPTDFLP
jgi:hypothetical protein